VDEAGFLSVRQMLQLQEFAIEHNRRLVVTGDTKQHHIVQWGDAKRIFERSGVIAQAELTKIHRQSLSRLVAVALYGQGRYCFTISMSGIFQLLSKSDFCGPQNRNHGNQLFSAGV
jgi:hypothetical protein